jgi:hypothetical protein
MLNLLSGGEAVSPDATAVLSRIQFSPFKTSFFPSFYIPKLFSTVVKKRNARRAKDLNTTHILIPPPVAVQSSSTTSCVISPLFECSTQHV